MNDDDIMFIDQDLTWEFNMSVDMTKDEWAKMTHEFLYRFYNRPMSIDEAFARVCHDHK